MISKDSTCQNPFPNKRILLEMYTIETTDGDPLLNNGANIISEYHFLSICNGRRLTHTKMLQCPEWQLTFCRSSHVPTLRNVERTDCIAKLDSKYYTRWFSSIGMDRC